MVAPRRRAATMFGLGDNKSDRVFFDAFETHAACISKATRLLVDMIRDPARSAELSKAISELEHQGDEVTHETIARLHKIWITPFDRMDIHGLISRLDDILDLAEAVSERFVLYELKSSPDFVAALAEVLVRAGDGVEKAIRLLPEVKRPKEILDLCVEIHRLENEADGGYRRALATLFKGDIDALTVLKWRDIVENLESATDRCEDVANILEGIVLEYA
jgi:predicted phosphate transport protein (TIGR00153 family)